MIGFRSMRFGQIQGDGNEEGPGIHSALTRDGARQTTECRDDN